VIIKQSILFLLNSTALLLISLPVSAEAVQHNLKVDGITCPFCVATSAKALKKIEGVNKVDADIKNGIIKVCADQSSDLNDDKLSQLFIDKGFTYRGKESLNECNI